MGTEAPRLLLNGELKSVVLLTAEELADLRETYGFAESPKTFFERVGYLVGKLAYEYMDAHEEREAYPDADLPDDAWRRVLAAYAERFERAEFHPWVVRTIAGALFKLNGRECEVASLTDEDVRAVLSKAPKTGWPALHVDELVGSRSGLDDAGARRWLCAYAWARREDGPLWEVRFHPSKPKA